MEVLGISLVTNLAAGISETALSHEEVIEAGKAAGPRISRLLAEIDPATLSALSHLAPQHHRAVTERTNNDKTR